MAKISKTKLKEQRINSVLSKYKIPFEISEAAIDLRTMSENYENGIIPNDDIAKVVDAILGPSSVAPKSIDPLTLNVPKFAWVSMDEIAIKPSFQRDVGPNSIEKIEKDFRNDGIIVPCAVKDCITGLFLLWDGHHTTRVCYREGWTHMPVWYTDANTDNPEDVAQAIKSLDLKAGRNFLSINKKNKRPVSRYDEHMISVECGEPVALQIKSILEANNAYVKRSSDDPGAVTHIAHLYDSYDLTQVTTGVRGMYLAKALQFHRTTWPQEQVHGIMLFSLARMYHLTELHTKVFLPNEFDIEFGDILRRVYGPSEAVEKELKQQFINHFGSLAAHPDVVTAGLVLTYVKHGKEFKLFRPDHTYPVK
jgi:hypothetical protein